MIRKRKEMNFAASIMFVVFGVLFLTLLSRFIFIGVTGEIEGKDLAAEASEKYAANQILQADRGTIYDRNKEILAEDSSTFKLIAILSDSVTTDPEAPRHVVDKEKTASILSKYIELDRKEILNRLQKKGAFQVEFGKAGRNISVSVKKEIEKEELPGITFETVAKRTYPNGNLAAHLIGIAQQKVSDDGDVTSKGILGIEKSYNDFLEGKDGEVDFESDKWGYILPNSKNHVTEPKNGNDIYLTIDEKIQSFVEEALHSVYEEYHPAKAFAIVSNPETGEILAVAQRPSFNRNISEGVESSWTNFTMQTAYEPGSTMKTFSLAAAVDAGVFKPNAHYNSGEFYVKGNPLPIKDWNYGNGWGSITYLEGLQRSSNVAFAELLDQIGEKKYLQYLHSFGFGEKIGLELENESNGRILYDYPIERYTTIFGQGTTVTAMQMVQAASAVANDGKMMKPYMVEKIVDSNEGKVIKQYGPKSTGTPISKEAAVKSREYLATTVTSDVGTGKPFKINGYEVAGKSGTAQIPNPNGSGYMTGHDNYFFSFLGMAPADDPKLVVYVGVQQPDLGGQLGSIPVAKIFNPVMQNSLKYLNIESTSTSPELESVDVPDMTEEQAEEAVKKLTDLGLKPVTIGKGKKITAQSTDGSLLKKEKILLMTDDYPTVPDMTGWSVRDVQKFVRLTDTKVEFKGHGYLKRQSVKPGSEIKRGTKLVVEFEPFGQ
ncbi:penicillin-binding protein [Rossellomorea aquimaris]|uniref:penicillin-binding protein n=1 Tax=Rossellomorea aquimaris TaxID=189382 RepID=UPI001CD539AB|nr:penicillin-binding transpeptidase domain-containing protein [Rossellomorea aquimaris]MCA1054001.1 penicillin-binding protein [Rossellomorea aquimaris]